MSYQKPLLQPVEGHVQPKESAINAFRVVYFLALGLCTLILATANWWLLSLALEAVMGSAEIRLGCFGNLAVRLSDVLAIAWVAAEVLCAALLAEVSGLLCVSRLRRRLGDRARTWAIGLGIGLLLMALGEAGVGLYRQRVVQSQAQVQRTLETEVLSAEPQRQGGDRHPLREGFLDKLPAPTVAVVHLLVPLVLAVSAALSYPALWFAVGVTFLLPLAALVGFRYGLSLLALLFEKLFSIITILIALTGIIAQVLLDGFLGGE